MIYFIQAEGSGHIKIGFTDADDAALRLAALQVGSPVPLKLLACIPGTMEDEKTLHRRFASSRVHGEWFRPVLDLLALIPSARPLACGGVEVTDKSVQIRVLTVGRKQLSKTMLNQLRQADLIDWFQTTAELAGLMGRGLSENTVKAVDLTRYVHGNLWGWVRSPADFPKGGRWLIFEREGRLNKQAEHKSYNPFDHAAYYSDDSYRWHRIIFDIIYPMRLALPGWRDSDQLFFGV